MGDRHTYWVSRCTGCGSEWVRHFPNPGAPDDHIIYILNKCDCLPFKYAEFKKAPEGALVIWNERSG